MTAKGKIFAKAVARGTRKFSALPAAYVDDVKEWLATWVATGENGMTAEKYEEITGEPYVDPNAESTDESETTEG